jgi:hypothetical protein
MRDRVGGKLPLRDQLLLGSEDDTTTWNPGDDNDVIEGEDGTDRIVFKRRRRRRDDRVACTQTRFSSGLSFGGALGWVGVAPAFPPSGGCS